MITERMKELAEVKDWTKNISISNSEFNLAKRFFNDSRVSKSNNQIKIQVVGKDILNKPKAYSWVLSKNLKDEWTLTNKTFGREKREKKSKNLHELFSIILQKSRME